MVSPLGFDASERDQPHTPKPAQPSPADTPATVAAAKHTCAAETYTGTNDKSIEKNEKAQLARGGAQEEDEGTVDKLPAVHDDAAATDAAMLGFRNTDAADELETQGGRAPSPDELASPSPCSREKVGVRPRQTSPSASPCSQAAAASPHASSPPSFIRHSPPPTPPPPGKKRAARTEAVEGSAAGLMMALRDGDYMGIVHVLRYGDADEMKRAAACLIIASHTLDKQEALLTSLLVDEVLGAPATDEPPMHTLRRRLIQHVKQRSSADDAQISAESLVGAVVFAEGSRTGAPRSPSPHPNRAADGRHPNRACAPSHSRRLAGHRRRQRQPGSQPDGAQHPSARPTPGRERRREDRDHDGPRRHPSVALYGAHARRAHVE